MRRQYTDRFKRAYADLDEDDAARVDKALRLLLVDPRHPSLRTKRIQGTQGVWEARASRAIRITFEMHGDLVILRNVGPHDRTLRKP